LAQNLQTLKCFHLIHAREAAIAHHVGGKYSGKPAFHALSSSVRRTAALGGEIHAVKREQECLLLANSGGSGQLFEDDRFQALTGHFELRCPLYTAQRTNSREASDYRF